MDENVRRGFRVRGRVQGVGFRWFAASRARELGVRGSVRNTADGAVEVVAEGPVGAVARLAERLGEGPPGARVDRVDEFAVEGGARAAAGFEVVG